MAFRHLDDMERRTDSLLQRLIRKSWTSLAVLGAICGVFLLGVMIGAA